MHTRSYFLYVLLAIILIAACVSTRKGLTIRANNQYYLYNPGSTYLHPDFLVYHNSDSTSQIFIKYYTDEILFNQANADQVNQANLKITYELYDITQDKKNPVLADSMTSLHTFDKKNIRKVLIVPVFVKALAGKDYTLKIFTMDNNRKASHTASLYVEKSSPGSVQNFKLIAAQGGAPLFRPYISKDDIFKIVSNRVHIDSLHIRYHKNDLSLPAPAFSLTGEKAYQFKADSTWTIPYNPGRNYNFQLEGIYFIQADTTKNEGLYLMNFGKYYPKLKTTDAMLEPLEYITTTTEYKKIKTEANQKLAIDNFWLKLGGNPDVSRELIRVYYTRMYFSNYYFTSFKEGWKTDRGMIYMIFGQPNYITKDPSSEKWEYYNTQTAKTVEFTFNKAPSPYTANHYVLERNDYLNGSWREAVDIWRSGKVYSAEE